LGRHKGIGRGRGVEGKIEESFGFGGRNNRRSVREIKKGEERIMNLGVFHFEVGRGPPIGYVLKKGEEC